MNNTQNFAFPRIILAGTHSGVGKTTLTLGLILAFKKRGLTVQPFKTGPDYIDPGFHSHAAGRTCRNLDTMLLSRNKVLELFSRSSRDADISLIEGVMGFFDGADNHKGSTFHLSGFLKAPVLLIINARAMAQSAAALAHGYSTFKRKSRIAGFLINQIGSENHFRMVKEAIEKKTGLPVLGYLLRNQDIALPERHLGLVPAWEKENSKHLKQKLLQAIEKTIDVDAIIKAASNADPLPCFSPSIFTGKTVRPLVRLALALDDAFHFYYQDNLDILKNLGADIIPFSPLSDPRLPDSTDGLYIGGGFPELYADKLQANFSIKKQILEHSLKGMPIYAECGGLMYLVERLVDFDGRSFEMTGIFPGEIRMGKKLKALGYCEALMQEDTILGRKGTHVKGHVFHWSVYHPPAKTSGKKSFSYAFKLEKSGKIRSDGFLIRNTLCNYVHIHFGSRISCANSFINHAAAYKRTGEVE